jgi:hypothetical protein
MGDNPEPPSQVLGLVSAFLSEHGLETTIKALRKELKRKNILTEFEPTQDGVNLQTIVESWNEKESQQSSPDSDSSEGSDSGTSSSDSDTSSATSSQAGAESDSSSDSASESDSEEEEVKRRPTKIRKEKGNKRATSPTTSSSSSDSDADDENEDGAKQKFGKKKSHILSQTPQPVRSLKRKAASSSSDSSSSESDSSTDDPPAKRAKVTIGEEASSSDASSSGSGASSSTSGEDESSDAETSSGQESADAGAPLAKAAKDEASDDDTSSEEDSDEMEQDVQPAQKEADLKLPDNSGDPPSDSSSNTVMGDVGELAEISTTAQQRQTAGKKKHVGARPTPLAQLSAQATPDSHISNAYRSYDYADRAYNDLIVTRGKGFTKEKNKKKRGSYRGGAIDISGGKGFKFDD